MTRSGPTVAGTDLPISVCLPAVFGGTPLPEALETLVRLGVTHYECWMLGDIDPKELRARNDALGLTLLAFCTTHFTLTDRSAHSAYREALKRALDTAVRLDTPFILTQVGHTRPGATPTDLLATVAEGLASAAPLLADSGRTLLVEPLNIRIDHPHDVLAASDDAARLLTDVGSPHIRMLYDIYHQTVTGEDPDSTLPACLPQVAHLHVAGIPGRHEPLGAAAPTDIPALCARAAAAGYTGALGLEYLPNRAPEASLCQVLAALSTLAAPSA